MPRAKFINNITNLNTARKMLKYAYFVETWGLIKAYTVYVDVASFVGNPVQIAEFQGGNYYSVNTASHEDIFSKESNQ